MSCYGSTVTIPWIPAAIAQDGDWAPGGNPLVNRGAVLSVFLRAWSHQRPGEMLGIGCCKLRHGAFWGDDLTYLSEYLDGFWANHLGPTE